MSAPSPALAAFLLDTKLAAPGEESTWTPLAGGVSSDIWRVTTTAATFCVKRALPKLRVAADWEAPVERNAYEWEYMRVAGAIAPDAIPRLLAHDPANGLFAMQWLAPETYRLWKSELLAGRVDVGAAARVGDLLGRIHAATARDPSLPARFATDASFHALRIDAYLLATARVHPDLAPRIEAIAAHTAAAKHALVHGDVSPKNILLGPHGPVLLDAECAWFGDPAFDLAFCLNHLAIKRRVAATAAGALADSFAALARAYLAHVDWEPRAALEARAADLLPALALARVDGKSPLEYLDEPQRAALRAAARAALLAAPRDLAAAQLRLAA
ncbi:MAG: aminoglycoside phosphotransferase family protein [Hyphomonadaceae bacterium]|nr:aminoglycoside phosphotransferase family protein [Hyphomonadaceae bacterium]